MIATYISGFNACPHCLDSMMTAFRQPMTDIDLTLRVLGPFADELKSGFGEHRPRCVLARCRRGIHFNGFALGASASRLRPPVIPDCRSTLRTCW